MNKKISDKDKKAWEEFVNSKDKVLNKDKEVLSENFSYKEKTIDLHGYTLDEANIEIEKIIFFCFEKKNKKNKCYYWKREKIKKFK